MHRYLLNVAQSAILFFLLLFNACDHGTNPVVNREFDNYRFVFINRESNIFILRNLYNPQITQLTFDGSSRMPKWSPKGDVIACISSSNDLHFANGLFIISLDGKSRKLLTPLSTYNQSLIFGLAWSPDGGRIAFVSSLNGANGEQNIWIINADGQNKKQLTTGGWNLDPVWFPDGWRLAFLHFSHTHEGGETSISRLSAININTGYFYQPLPPHSGMPVFSPDGRSVAFTSNLSDTTHGATELYISDIDGKTYEQLINDGHSRVKNVPIGFSQDSKKLFFASYLTYNYVLSTVEISEIEVGGAQRRVLKKVENLARATLSPDRQKILLWIWRESQGVNTWLDLYILSADGKDYFKLLEEVRDPDWGPIN